MATGVINKRKSQGAGQPPPPNKDLVLRAEAPWRKTIKRFLRHKLAVVGVIILLVLVLAAIFAPVICRYTPEALDLRARAQDPSANHWFGTDRVGRDTFTRTVYGGQISLMVGAGAVAISVAVAIILGALAGFFGGWVDMLVMRFADIVMTFPPIIIVLTVAALTGPGIYKVILIIGFLNWPVPCRLLRSKFLTLREQEFAVAARALGVPTKRIIFRHMLPNALDVLIVYASLGMANAILLEAGLSFLGLGVEQPTSSWGNLLDVARNVSTLEQYPWQWMPAGVAIILAVLAINFIGDGLRDALDPMMKI